MTIGKILPVALLILVVFVVSSKCNPETTSHEDLATINPSFDQTPLIIKTHSKNAVLARVKRQFGNPYGYDYGYPYYNRRQYYPYPLPIIVPRFGGQGFGGPRFGGQGFGGPRFGGQGFGGPRFGGQGFGGPRFGGPGFGGPRFGGPGFGGRGGGFGGFGGGFGGPFGRG